MSKSGYLTGSEYKAIRQTLGFTLEEAKKFHKVQNITTIKRWESGYSRVSELACDKIMALFERTNWVIAQAIDVYKELRQKGDVEIVLIVYPESCIHKFVHDLGDLPASVHRATVGRTYIALKELGADVGIVEFNPQDYFIFLGKNNLTDGQDSRSAWAAQKRKELLNS